MAKTQSSIDALESPLTAAEVLKAIGNGTFEVESLRRIAYAASKQQKRQMAVTFPLSSTAWIDQPGSRWHGVSGRVVKVNANSVQLDSPRGLVNVPMALVRK